jgi:D-alanine-D-alanine ligase
LKIAIIFGAVSYEHEISIVSAIAMKDVLKSELVYIFCDKNREFYLISVNDITSKLFSSGEYKKSPRLTLKNGGFYQKSLMKEKLVEFDVALNLSHGADGEDGKIASLLEFFEIPFIGPRVDASVISFNKLFTKLYAKSLGVEVVDFEVLKKGAYKISLDYPVIIKPLRLGSSIGVSIVRDASELEYALDVAYEFDDEVLVEPFIEGVKEYNLAGLKADEFIFSIVEEPQKEEFLDFDKKYLDFSRTSRVNSAQIDSYLEENLKLTFQKIYGSLFEGALIRCDFFLVDG